MLELRRQRAINGQQVFGERLEKEQLVIVQQARRLCDRLRMLVHPQINHAVVEAAVAASLTHDEQRGGLLAATIPSRALPCRQRLY